MAKLSASARNSNEKQPLNLKLGTVFNNPSGSLVSSPRVNINDKFETFGGPRGHNKALLEIRDNPPSVFPPRKAVHSVPRRLQTVSQKANAFEASRTQRQDARVAKDMRLASSTQVMGFSDA